VPVSLARGLQKVISSIRFDLEYSMPSLPNLLLLGIGNLLWADEVFGVRTLESLQRHYRFLVAIVESDSEHLLKTQASQHRV
jgi:hypothetical protein